MCFDCKKKLKRENDFLVQLDALIAKHPESLAGQLVTAYLAENKIREMLDDQAIHGTAHPDDAILN